MTKSWDFEEGIPNFKPLIIGFVADLLFSSKIEAAATKLNFEVYWIENSGQIPTTGDTQAKVELADEIPGKSPGEQLSGIQGAMLDLVTSLQPALIIIDLGNPSIPWRAWLPILKSVPATRRIPVLCYGSHVDKDGLKAANSSGADAVVARSRLATDLPLLIQKYARLPDYSGLAMACKKDLSPLAVKGLEEFNRGAYFEAHEFLEAAWNEDNTPGRELYRAILQVAVAYLQIERLNFRGAMKIFMRLRYWIDPLPDHCRGVNLIRLREDINKVHGEITRLGPNRMNEFDPGWLHPIKYEDHEQRK